MRKESAVKRKHICYGMCCVLILCITINKGFPQVNLLVNAGMESWSGGLPDNWDKTGSSYIDEENSEKHDGVASARFQVPTTTTTVELNQDISVIGGNYYSFQCWVYDNTLNGDIGLLINWRNAEGS